jgi:GT2 family glycosyltransferase
MSPEPLISAVVPTRGRPRYLERCLDALAAADYPPRRFEIVVVDDSDGDQIERVAAAVRGRVAPRIVRPQGTGPSAARNAGAFAARAEFIAFTDDDCEPSPRWLSALARALTADRGIAVGGRTLNGAKDNTAAAASQLVIDAVHAGFNGDQEEPRFFASYNVAFPADAFRELGGFDESFRYAEDRELCERWVRSGHRFAYALDALVVHMRRLGLSDFWRQHYGYGRGACAFRTARGGGEALADSRGVLREVGRAARGSATSGRLGLTGYLALSQLATAAGFAREAVSRGLSRG